MYSLQGCNQFQNLHYFCLNWNFSWVNSTLASCFPRVELVVCSNDACVVYEDVLKTRLVVRAITSVEIPLTGKCSWLATNWSGMTWGKRVLESVIILWDHLQTQLKLMEM